VVLVDTNVLAYLLIAGDQTKTAQALYARDSDWRSEAFLLIEFSNILSTYIRADALTLQEGLQLHASAQSLMPTLTHVEHARALEVGAEFTISAYDARFIALAMQMGVKLVTQDMKLRRAVPAWTRALEDAAAG